MKRVPSVLLPARAKNTWPGLTVRLSTARPDTSAALARGSIVASSLNSSPTLMIFQSGHGNCPVVFRSAETLFKRGTGKSEHRNPVPDRTRLRGVPELLAGGVRCTPYWLVFDAARIRRSDGGRSK